MAVTPAVALGDADVRNREAGNGRGGVFTPDLFLMNGKSGTAIDSLNVKEGERVRVRLINAGNLVHAMHTHGHSFKIVATDGNPVPPAAQLIKDTVLIGPAERYDVELVANNPGVWMFHCHINNHSANGMVTELRYDGSAPLAGGDHSSAHAAPSPRPATAPPSAASTTAAAGPHAGDGTPSTSATVQPPSPSPTPAAAPPVQAEGAVEVRMLDDRFTPSRQTVKVGTTVTWLAAGNNQHSTSSLNALWDSGLIDKGASFSFTFDKPGVYQYLCRQHLLQGMRGTITVEE